MLPRARLFALRVAAGLLPLGVATAHAEPEGGGTEDRAGERPEAETRGPTKLGVGGLRARGTRLTSDDDEGLSKREDRKWIRRWAPERGMIELGVLGGLVLPARDLELFEPRVDRPRQGFLSLAPVAPEVGVRVGYFPLRFVGLELEGALAPTTTRDDGYTAYLFTGRGHVIGQLPFASVAPFVLVGGGALGIRSDPEVVLGQDIDAATHLGIGSKFFINRRLVARVDLRDVISPRRGIQQGATNTIEVLVGLSLTLGRERDVDERPAEPLPPPAPSDRDGDGFVDDEDRCPDEAGVAPDGCPVPGDRDGDGFVDEQDRCPDEAGIEPEGCPDLDADRDGILLPDDQCPEVPENINGYQDGDGCEDEVPEDLKRFGGRLEGIHFELGKATLTASSLPILDEAVGVLNKYDQIRIGISGHTDNSGARELNMSLSQQRAEAVKAYLVEAGIDPSRIETRGAGPDEPLDSNATKEGRANNRRIEFRVLD